MTDPETTLPPHQPNTPRVWLRRLWAWTVAHPGFAIPVATFLLGAVIGLIL